MTETPADIDLADAAVGAAPKKAPARKTAKKATARKTASKQPAAKKTAATKASAAKRAPAKKAPAKKTTAKKTTAKKTTAKKTAAKRAPAPAGTGLASAARRQAYRTLDERVARGIAWRDDASLDSHAEYQPNRQRTNPIDILRQQDDVRVQELIPIRYGRMSASAFAFYRGSAAVMAYDLSSQAWTPGRTQICGDAHLSNFGVFGSPERDLVFDLNDFDETLPGPFEWDVKRLAASIVLAARDRGFRRKEARQAVRATLDSYRTVIGEMSRLGTLDVWYARIDERMLLEAVAEMRRDKRAAKNAEKRALSSFEAARRKTSMRAAQKLTEVVDGKQQFREDPPLLSRAAIDDEYRARVAQAFAEYRETLQPDRRRLIERYQLVDVALKVVGVGSVGTRAGIMLLHGRDASDPLIMQFKEANASVLEAYLGESRTSQHGERVVDGQRYMQAVSDIFLGWVKGAGGRHFYVRQLHDMKGSIDVTKIQPFGLLTYGRLCGATLARAHARGGDVVAIDAYIGDDDTFVEAIEEFAQVYADQAEQDYGRLQQAISSGDIEVRTGI